MADPELPPAPPPAPRARREHDSDFVFHEVHLTDPGLDAIPHPFWRSWKASFEAAVAGVLRTVATQRNMKVHTTAAMMVMLVGMGLPLNLATRSALVFLIAAVMFAEILNTALEALVDLFIGTYSRLAMLAKDAAAAGVLILAVGAVVIFFDILIANWQMVADNVERVILYASLGVPVVILQLIILFGPRKGVLPWLLTALGLGLLVPLIGASLDPLFSAGSVLVLLASRVARARFPGRMPRGAPHRSSSSRP
jgi:diacylglycerol kinase (ATP)